VVPSNSNPNSLPVSSIPSPSAAYAPEDIGTQRLASVPIITGISVW